jgi:6-pyruvoyltetrahydropterin/6-carboxytetrahydropterin synthase
MARYVLEVAAGFEAAHHLTSYRGAPEPVHGHSFRVIARLSAGALDAEGIACDFVAVRDALVRLTARFDHRDVNTVPPFDVVSPTTERLAEWFFTELARELGAGAPLAAVTVFEGPDASATFDAEEGRP